MLLTLLNVFFLDAQTIPPRLDSVMQKLSVSLSEYYKRYPQEKIFLHTNQDIYTNSETIWFKAYAMAYGKPSQLSEIVYVRLSDAYGKLIKQDKLPLKNGTAFGDITLPDSIPTGWYRLQAFTAWMLNFGEDGFYHKNIYIQNFVNKGKFILTGDTKKSYHINFFPEGGDLVDGNICNIAFKATDENGLPVNIKGVVLNNHNNIAQLVTIHDGMGNFELEANTNVNYIAQVHFPDNSVQSIALPKVKKTGLNMRVNTAPADEFEVKITYTDKQPFQDIILTAMQNNGLSINYPLTLSHGTNIFSFKKNGFSTGIVRLTVFDKTGTPGAERIVFVNNNDQLNLSLVKDTLSFIPKSKNVFTVHLKDDKNQPVKANLSLSITDASIATGPEDNIYTYLLMSSELHGYINQPAYYFKNNSDTLQKQLDLVMLTNGWRHFKWDSILNIPPWPLKYYVEKSQFIAGKIENYHNRDQLKIKLIISNDDSTKHMVELEPDSIGRFFLKDYNHPGNATVYYEAVNSKNVKQAVKVTFFKPVIDSLHFRTDSFKNPDLKRPAFNKPYRDSVLYWDSVLQKQNAIFSKNGIVLKAVAIKGRKTTQTELLLKNHVHRLNPDNAYTLDLVNTTLSSMNLIDYIKGRFPGLQIIDSTGGATKFVYRGMSTVKQSANSQADQPYFYIDEASATLEEVEEISLNDVALVRFAPPPVYFAPLNGGNNGALLIYMKRFGDEGPAGHTRKTYDQYLFNGYSVTREFPVVDYNITKQEKKADYRTTLYWNHDLFTDDKGTVKIHFYNPDKSKTHRVVIHAMDSNGHVGYLDEQF
ncbi:MAG: hypothetical protein JWP45_3020 [Mucilaginibacter sp.]|nr:hypothetical protein [Mucilaginibacter sp.]